MDETKRRRGRPKAAEPSEPVFTRLRVRDYDQLAIIALRRRESLSSVVRRILLTQLRSRPGRL